MPKTITAIDPVTAWRESKTWAELHKHRRAVFTLTPGDHRRLISPYGRQASVCLVRSELMSRTQKVLDHELSALARFLDEAGINGIAGRFRVIDSHSEDVGEIKAQWQDLLHQTVGTAITRADAEVISGEIEQRAVRAAESPDKPYSPAPADRGAARGARLGMLQPWLSATGTEPTEIVRILALSAGIHAGRISLWLSGEMNLNARERAKLAALIGVTPEEIL